MAKRKPIHAWKKLLNWPAWIQMDEFTVLLLK